MVKTVASDALRNMPLTAACALHLQWINQGISGKCEALVNSVSKLAAMRLLLIALSLFVAPLTTRAQLSGGYGYPAAPASLGNALEGSSASAHRLNAIGSAGLTEPASPAVWSSSALEPSATGSGTSGGGFDHYEIAPAATWRQIPFSRMGIGADISPLGIGLKSAIVLNHYFDARLMGNFFSLDTGRFEINGFNVDAKVHMASAAAALDFYPFGSVFRFSPGVMFYNGNQISATANINPGTDFSFNNKSFYSAKPNPVTGATPLMGVGTFGFHKTQPALTLTTGFGKFIPHSERHWSFPVEFGVALTGSPTVQVVMSGWACEDPFQKKCSNVADLTNPVGASFNNELQTRLNKLRGNLDKVQVYPMFSTSVVYSFNIR